MAILSILLSLVAAACTVLGFLTTPIPVVGVVFSFGAAAIAIAGIMLGGRSVSQAKKLGLPNDVARIGVVLNVLAFIPAVLVAVTCGVCNAVVSTGNVKMTRDFRIGLDPDLMPNAGAPAFAPDEQPPPPVAGAPAGDAPPTRLPPPPLPAGPSK